VSEARGQARSAQVWLQDGGVDQPLLHAVQTAATATRTPFYFRIANPGTSQLAMVVQTNNGIRMGTIGSQSGLASVFSVTPYDGGVSANYFGFAGTVTTFSGSTDIIPNTRFLGATSSGSPTHGTFLKGDWVLSWDGNIYICTVAGTSGTWVQVGAGGGSYLPLSGGTLTGALTVGSSGTPANTTLNGELALTDYGASAGDALVSSTVSQAITSGNAYLATSSTMTTGYAFLHTDTGLTSGGSFRASSTHITSGAFFSAHHDTSTFTGHLLFANMAVGSGSFSGDFFNLQVNSVGKFLLDQNGSVSLAGALDFNALSSASFIKTASGQEIAGGTGGSALTFKTTGSSGPATAAQHGWLKVLDHSGTATFVPVWQ
jgi:hypothetical protein